MPKYIDKEKLLRDLRGVRDGLVSQGDPFLASVVTAAIGCVGVQKVADVVEIVRCSECAVPHNQWTGCPRLNGLVVPDGFYCARGERKTDGKPEL